ncbi:hypothetical protein TGAM01_v211093 [Trichoderma gamsii]|uniref:Zn(2)-C6 fungal-type domain-containing protein n=1 Tax=Trichoderma gamsii TaxID=398673 RepID=A0A2P4Z6X7_9HYPO|nr:hypothetical protein TGAM01_v211093 [Trichoderma gamsii]PON20033.1 hypothetical protein TGAM01_v211093 [Trichoderma gamsii]
MMTDRVRRNGQLSACEPCRKSKLRCDHSRPICGRCARRRRPQQQCHYHPAPTAKQATPQSDRETADQSEVPGSIERASSPYELINMNKNLMSFADSSTPRPHHSYTALTSTGVALPQPCPPSQQTISEGATLLSDILELVNEIGEPFQSFSMPETEPCIHGPLVKAVWTTTNNSIQALLSNRSALDLASISEAIFDRTSSPPVFPPNPASGALESAFSVQALRWEMIGLYCAQIGVYLGEEKDRSFSLSAHESWKTDRKTLMHRAFQACIQCESFCGSMGAINDLTLWFIMLTTLLATWCFGDDSYHALRLVGSMSSVVFALGFYKGVQNDPSVPFYMTEIRKRAVACAHDLDKVCASFTSRPVHLSRHFCVIELPLDIADSALMGEPEMLLKARQNLDADGWSKDKAVLPVSVSRARLLLSMLREEALELKLGPAASNLEAKAGADHEWALVFYAMPCASVLVLELLRQSQHPVEQSSIDRSSVIQDISVLITCCDSWAECGQSNYQICKQAQSIFSKSLDSILNNTEPINRDRSEGLATRQHEHQNELTGFISPEILNVAAQDSEWLVWLDSLGLQGDLWLDSNIPTLEIS